MDRLNQTNINKPELAFKFFKERWRSCLHWCDWERYKKLASRYTGGAYLDVGCFNSPMPYELKIDARFKNDRIVAIDYCEELIAELKTRFPEVEYQVGDANKMVFKDEEFDYVVGGELLEHMESPKDTVKELMRVLKVGGTLAITVPLNELERGGISDEHMWSFSSMDLIELLSPYGDVQVEYIKDSVPLLVAFCKKNGQKI